MKPHIREKIEDLLKASGLRRTGPRMAVLAVLLEAGRPVTQQEIAKSLGRESPNKVTIYRALERLIDSGIVHRAFLRERSWHFEPADNCSKNQCHPHFTCNKCGDTHCMTNLSLPLAKGLEKGFILQRQQIRLEGLCPSCT
ncbi:MAG: Fur family transcriptional regulator [Planctomycetota bacterium]|jgi:Fur family ferric uptake transcriptional regulator